MVKIFKKELKFKFLSGDINEEIFIQILNISMNNPQIKQKNNLKIEQFKKTVEKVKFLVKKGNNKNFQPPKIDSRDNYVYLMHKDSCGQKDKLIMNYLLLCDCLEGEISKAESSD